MEVCCDGIMESCTLSESLGARSLSTRVTAGLRRGHSRDRGQGESQRLWGLCSMVHNASVDIHVISRQWRHVGADATHISECNAYPAADCSTSRDQCTWGLGAVLATIEGVILRRWRAPIRAHYSSTMDMEATDVAENLHTTVESVQQEGVMIWPWCDNQSAAVHCNARNPQAQHWQPRTQIAASLELLYERCPFRCG